MALVKYNKPNIYRTGLLRLLPGNNQVSDKIWEVVQNWPQIKSRIESKVIEVISKETANTSSSEEENPLEKMNAKQAKEFIGETFDRELLKKWANLETRDGVSKAIKAQIDSLTTQVEKE